LLSQEPDHVGGQRFHGRVRRVLGRRLCRGCRPDCNSSWLPYDRRGCRQWPAHEGSPAFRSITTPAHLCQQAMAGRAGLTADLPQRIFVACGQDGRGPVGGPHLIYPAHSAKESSTPVGGFRNGRSILGLIAPNDGRDRPGNGRGDESRCRRRSGNQPWRAVVTRRARDAHVVQNCRQDSGDSSSFFPASNSRTSLMLPCRVVSM